MSKKHTLLVIDGNSLTHRAHHAYVSTGMRTPEGSARWAHYGVGALLAGICAKTRPDALAFGFDDSSRNVRREGYPLYKAGRVEKSEDLVEALREIPQLLTELGIPVLTPEGWEADDVLGSCASLGEREGWNVILATSDRDAIQLVTETTKLFRLGNGLDSALLMGVQEIIDKYGVSPDLYLDYAALRGDSSDNLPGVMGFGEKTAASLLVAMRDLGGLDAAIADPALAVDAIGRARARRLGEKETADVIKRNRAIMAIRKDLPDVAGVLEAGRLVAAPEKVKGTLLKWGLPSLVGRLGEALAEPGRAQAWGEQRVSRNASYQDIPDNLIEEPPVLEPMVPRARESVDNSAPTGTPRPSGLSPTVVIIRRRKFLPPMPN